MLLFEYGQNGEARGACDRISAKGAEELHPVVETSSDFASGDHGRQRERVSDGFAQHHNVRDDALRLESPEVRAETAETNLHFIGDAYAAGGADVPVGFGEISGRKNNLAGDTWQRFGDVRCDVTPSGAPALQDFCYTLRVFGSRRGITPPIRSAIIIRNWRDVNPRFRAAASGTIKFVRADVDERRGVTVVGVFKDHHVFAAGVSAGQAQGELVRLAAGVHEIADIERFR